MGKRSSGSRAEPAGSGSRGATLTCVGYTAIGVLPLYMVSALAVEISRDLHFDKAQFGLAIGLHFAAGAAAAAPLGHLVERIGIRFSNRGAMTFPAASAECSVTGQRDNSISEATSRGARGCAGGTCLAGGSGACRSRGQRRGCRSADTACTASEPGFT